MQNIITFQPDIYTIGKKAYLKDDLEINDDMKIIAKVATVFNKFSIQRYVNGEYKISGKYEDESIKAEFSIVASIEDNKEIDDNKFTDIIDLVAENHKTNGFGIEITKRNFQYKQYKCKTESIIKSPKQTENQFFEDLVGYLLFLKDAKTGCYFFNKLNIFK